VLFNNFDNFLKILVGILVIEEPIGQLFQGLKKAVEVHLIVVTPTNHILVYYVVVGLKNMAVGQTLVLR
jgi:hypothetical protein